MLGFTLSKLNLLILVTAMFAIIAFFLFSLTDIVVSGLAQQMVKDYSETSFGLVSGELLCRKSSVTIPESIDYFGGMTPTQRFYYVMYIKRFPEQPVEGQLTMLIYQIASRKDKEKIIATSSMDLNAKVFLYEWDSVNDILSEQSSIALDPESPGIATKNSMVLIKEVYNGQNYLHIIACSSSSAVCLVNLDKASCLLSRCGNPPRQSTCFPQVEASECDSMRVNC